VRRAPPVPLHWKERRELSALAETPQAPTKLRRRARVVLRASEGALNKQIAEELGTDPGTVARWRQRFLLHGTPGIMNDAPRPGRPRAVPDSKVGLVIRLTLERRAPGTRPLSIRSLARETGISKSTIQRIWKAQRIGPHHRPEGLGGRTAGMGFLEKVTDMVGLYLNPPARAIAFSTDERLHSSRLKGRELQALRQFQRRGQGVEFRAFLQVIDRETQPKFDVHLLLDSRLAPAPPELQHWLGQHPRFHLHYLPSDRDGRTLIDRLVVEFSRRRARLGDSPSAQRLRERIRDHFRTDRGVPGPFVWTTAAQDLRPS
jgi:transposase-like protein